MVLFGGRVGGKFSIFTGIIESGEEVSQLACIGSGATVAEALESAAANARAADEDWEERGISSPDVN